MNKAYSRIVWENYPSEETPINETNLNKMDSTIDTLDNRIISLDTTKAKESEVLTMVQDVSYNQSNGVFTVTKKNGSKVTLDTKLEKLAVNFAYDSSTQKLIITLDDGTKQYVDLSALITQYEFTGSDTVSFTIDSSGKVTAAVKDGSITEAKLQPNYLANIKVEVSKAQASQTAAATSETNAKASQTAAATSATNAKTSETNAATSETNAKASQTAAATSATNAKTSETNAKTSETNAKASQTAAATSATNAKTSETNAKASQTVASNMAIKAESYAVGDTNTRDNESTDNAKYYYELAKAEAGKVIVDSALSSTSAHPVQNKVINSALSSYLPLTGGTMTGNIEFANVESGYRSIGGKVGNNDYWRVGGGATSANNGYLEIATADDGNEPIYVKQYSSGKFVTLKRTATLLDGGGNTSFPGRMSANEVMIGGSVTLSYDSTDKCVNFTFA